MECEILASVMNQKDKDEIIKRLNISDDDKCIIINQITTNMIIPKNDIKSNHKFISYKENGLSRSRNHALDNAKGNICILSDDDMTFVGDYQKIVKRAYRKYTDADVIAFDYICVDGSRKTMRGGKVGFLRSMKLSSAQLTFKRDSFKKAKIKFDDGFGAGLGRRDWGEENILLFDCLRAGLNIYFVPEVIRVAKEDFGTTWDKSNTPEHYEQQGAIYYRMSSRWWKVLILQFVLRKRKIYRKDMSSWTVYRSMMRGAKEYWKEQKNG